MESASIDFRCAPHERRVRDSSTRAGGVTRGRAGDRLLRNAAVGQTGMRGIGARSGLRRNICVIDISTAASMTSVDLTPASRGRITKGAEFVFELGNTFESKRYRSPSFLRRSATENGYLRASPPDDRSSWGKRRGRLIRAGRRPPATRPRVCPSSIAPRVPPQPRIGLVSALGS